MNLFFARDFNICKNSDITSELASILHNLRAESGEKTLVFEKGTYFLSSKKSEKLPLDITNTMGEKEWDKKDEKRVYKCPFVIENTNNLTIDFKGSTLIIRGVCTNMVILNSKNINIKNVEIKVENPNMHEVRVLDKTSRYVDYVIDSESRYEKKLNKFYFVGEDYKYSFTDKVLKTWWAMNIKRSTPDKVKRCGHPFCGATLISELAPYKLRVYYANTKRFEIDEKFYLYDVRRKNVGIFIDNCQDIVLEKIAQRFNYSLAVVCQHTHNLTIDKADFSPIGAKKIASIADFVQVCMCSGDVNITNCNFEGAGDDCLNVHGFHFKVKEACKNKVVCSFMHPQSYGFLPFDKGDKVAFIDKNTLLETGEANVIGAKMLNKYDIELELDNSDAKVNMMIENVSKNPNLLFSGNKLNRIITRGILVTTRGKVQILDNVFNNNSMSGILISDDANAWYESGMVKNVLISGNTFNNSEEYDILIKPENNKFAGYVHNNIVIKNNTFASPKNGGIFVKDSGNVTICDNTITSKSFSITNKNSQIVEA